MNRYRLASFLLFGILIMSIASPAPAESEDSRFTLLHDKDHPVDFVPAYSDRAAWEKRAAFLRTQFLVAEGLWPMPEKCPLDPVVTGKIDCGDYTIENVYFRSMPGHYVTGSLYRPKGRSGKLPAVLSPHGHSVYGRFVWHTPAEVKAMLDRGEEQSEAGAITPTQARCAMLAQMGCIVFVYDMVGMGDSQKINHWHSFEDAEALLRLQSEMGLQTWNSIRSLDYLESLPDVDPTRIAMCGESGGGTQTIALTVVDPRVAAAFPAVMVSENMQGGCICENAPLAHRHEQRRTDFHVRPQAAGNVVGKRLDARSCDTWISADPIDLRALRRGRPGRSGAFSIPARIQSAQPGDDVRIHEPRAASGLGVADQGKAVCAAEDGGYFGVQ